VKATHRPSLTKEFFEDDEFKGNPGDFQIVDEANRQRRLWFVCPGCHQVSAIAIRPVIDGSAASWEWDGNIENPTLTPSIHHIGCWHGWLTDGQFVSC
jgi:hypothetical protein